MNDVTKVAQTMEELMAHLQEQLGYMEKSAAAFDEGDLTEAKRLAGPLRILLHDKGSQKSLLGLLGWKENLRFYDTYCEPSPYVVGPFIRLIIKGIVRGEAKYVAPLDDLPPSRVFRMSAFEEYWSSIVLTDGLGNSFARKDLVLFLAEQDGGVHVDPALNEPYDTLTKRNSLGWVWSAGGEPNKPIEDEILAMVRQIAHEVLKTLISDYPIKKLF